MAKKWSKARRESFRVGKRYVAYKKSYLKREALLAKKGYTMYDQQMLSKTEYKEMYQATLNDRKKEVKSGERRSVGNINEAIVSMQAYELSEKSAYAIFDFLEQNKEKYGLEYDTSNINDMIMKIRQGEWLREDVQIWDLITDYRSDLFDKGYSKAQVRAQIAITMFGSDPEKYKDVR